MQVQFYHLLQTQYDRALPALLNKALQAKMPVCVKLADSTAVEKLDKWLWSYDPNSFLPHGTHSQPYAEEQPVLLSDQIERPNQASAVMVVDGTVYAPEDGIEKLFDLFDGNNPEAVQAARTRWKHYKDHGLDITYWQQQPNGSWKKAA